MPIAYQKKNTKTTVKILILKQTYTETSGPSLEALSQGVSGVFEHPVLHMHTENIRFVLPIDCNVKHHIFQNINFPVHVFKCSRNKLVKCPE